VEKLANPRIASCIREGFTTMHPWFDVNVDVDVDVDVGVDVLGKSLA